MKQNTAFCTHKCNGLKFSRPDFRSHEIFGWMQCTECIAYRVVSHYNCVIMSATAYQITSVTFVYIIVCSGSDQRKHQSSASLVFVMGIHQWPVNSPHKTPVTRKMFPFDEVIINFTAFIIDVGRCHLPHHSEWKSIKCRRVGGMARHCLI